MKPLQTAPLNSSVKVLVRCDLDVPLENGQIKETFRLDQMLPTLNFVKQAGAKIIIAGHIGKPHGKVVPELSTKQLLPYFNQKLGADTFELLENLRFDPREEANIDSFAAKLAAKANIYVNESFATCHRMHSSIVGIPKYLPSYAGLRLQKEIEVLSKVLKNPVRPLTAIIGGAKLESKKPVVAKFLHIADYVMLGGKLGLAWTEEIPENLLLPLDYAHDQKDLGPQTIQGFTHFLTQSKTVIWAGPLGMYEQQEFAKATYEIAKVITSQKLFSVVGGGDTISALNRLGLLNNFSFISTGGSAMLEYLAKETLPGLEALNAKN